VEGQNKLIGLKHETRSILGFSQHIQLVNFGKVTEQMVLDWHWRTVHDGSERGIVLRAYLFLNQGQRMATEIKLTYKIFQAH
jgi:hypothetical protein